MRYNKLGTKSSARNIHGPDEVGIAVQLPSTRSETGFQWEVNMER